MVVSICAPSPASTRRPTPRADRSCTVLTRWARLRPAERVVEFFTAQIRNPNTGAAYAKAVTQFFNWGATA